MFNNYKHFTHIYKSLFEMVDCFGVAIVLLIIVALAITIYENFSLHRLKNNFKIQ